MDGILSAGLIKGRIFLNGMTSYVQEVTLFLAISLLGIYFSSDSCGKYGIFLAYIFPFGGWNAIDLVLNHSKQL